ncbi:sphingomyelin phosphodiesterase, partial [Streptomyces parvus]
MAGTAEAAAAAAGAAARAVVPAVRAAAGAVRAAAAAVGPSARARAVARADVSKTLYPNWGQDHRAAEIPKTSFFQGNDVVVI